MSERLSKRMKSRMREISCARAPLAPSALPLATRHEQKELTAPQIADEARVSIDTFFEFFETKDECFLAALDMVGQELLTIAATDAEPESADWPKSVRKVIDQLLTHLAQHPLHARALVQDSYTAGVPALESNLALSEKLAEMLTRGAPAQAVDQLARSGVTGALWHVVRCQVADGRIQLLPALSDHLSYVVLAPFIGADAAAQIICEEPRR